MPISRRAVVALGVAAAACVPAPTLAGDQTAELQARIDAAQAGNGVLNLEAGVYPVATLAVSSSVVIAGVPGKTILQSLNGDTIINVNSASDVVLSGLVFDSRNVPPAAKDNLDGKYQLLAWQCSGILVETCVFKNTLTSASGFDACTGRVTGNQFFDIGQIALRVGRFFGTYPNESSRNMEVSSNLVQRAGNGGIYVFHTTEESEEDNTIVTNNHIQQVKSGSGNGQYGNGIVVFAANNVIVSNNRISDCDYSGIRIVTCKHCQVIGNNVSRSADTAIFVEFAFESVIVGNNLVEDVNFGIQLSGGDGVLGRTAICSNNIVRNVNRVGTNPQSSNFIGIDIVSMATSCIGNVIEDVGENEHGPGIGILVMDWAASHGHQIQSNMIKTVGCGIGLVLGEGATQVIVTGNTIAAASLVNISLLEQATYKDGSIKSLKPTGGDLVRENPEKDVILVSNNIALQ